MAALLSAGHQPPQMRIDPHVVATLPCSSGTTGLPKGVMLTHHILVANLCQLQPVLDQSEGDVVVAVLPFFPLYGQMVLMAAGLWTTTATSMSWTRVKELIKYKGWQVAPAELEASWSPTRRSPTPGEPEAVQSGLKWRSSSRA